MHEPLLPRDWLTLDDLAAELALSKHTLYKWSRKGPPFFPVCVRLPNQQIRVARRALEDWLRERSS